MARNDLEMFLQDLEEDPDLRANINIYRVSRTRAPMQTEQTIQEDHDGDDEEAPEIPIEELLEDMTLEDDESEYHEDGHGMEVE